MTMARANQRCVNCNNLVNYEGHDDHKTSLNRHRFHCHTCGRVYILQSTGHKMPTFDIKEHHETEEEEEEASH